MYTAARFIIYFCVSPCDESGLKQVQRNPSPLPVVRRACYTQGCRTRVIHHVRTTVERDARTRRKQRHVVVTKATLIYERCSVSRVDGLAITRNEGQFVSRLARTVVVSFSLLPPPLPPFFAFFFRYRNTREIRQFRLFSLSSTPEGGRNRSVVIIYCTRTRRNNAIGGIELAAVSNERPPLSPPLIIYSSLLITTGSPLLALSIDSVPGLAP